MSEEEIYEESNIKDNSDVKENKNLENDHMAYLKDKEIDNNNENFDGVNNGPPEPPKVNRHNLICRDQRKKY